MYVRKIDQEIARTYYWDEMRNAYTNLTLPNLHLTYVFNKYPYVKIPLD